MTVVHAEAIQLAEDLWQLCPDPCKISIMECVVETTATFFDGDPRTDGIPRLTLSSGKHKLYLDMAFPRGCYVQGSFQGMAFVYT